MSVVTPILTKSRKSVEIRPIITRLLYRENHDMCDRQELNRKIKTFYLPQFYRVDRVMSSDVAKIY